MKNKRYWVFIMDRFDPSGGMGDYVKSLADIPSNATMEKMSDTDEDIGTVEIYDSKKHMIVKRMDYDHGDIEHVDKSEYEAI